MARPKDTEQRISGREAEYLRYFWNEGSLTIRELIDLLPEPHPHVNTVATVLKSLENKGFILREPDTRPTRYKAAPKANACGRRTLSSVIRNFFNDSYTSVISALVEDEKLSLDELKEIVDIIERQNLENR